MAVIREYGTSWKDVRMAGVAGVITFIVFLLIKALNGFGYTPLHGRPLPPIAPGMSYMTFAVLVSVFLPALAAFTALIRIRVTERFVQHVFAGAVLSEHRREGLRDVRIWGGFSFPLVLTFSDGSRISTFMYLPAAQCVASDLQWIREGAGSAHEVHRVTAPKNEPNVTRDPI